MKHSKRKVYLNQWERGGELIERLPPDDNPVFSGMLTGFTMGEGSFCVIHYQSKTHLAGVCLKPEFKIKLKYNDDEILRRFSSYLRCGKVFETSNQICFRVHRLVDLVEVIIPFFDKYPLENVKAIDFHYFKIICYKLVHGEGKYPDGIRRILSIRDHMNEGGYIRKKVSI